MSAEWAFKSERLLTSVFVFGSAILSSSTIIKLLFLSLSERICFKASCLVRFGIFFNERTPLKLWAIPPLLNIFAFLEPCLAPPLPFCLPSFCVVPFTSDLFLVLALRGFWLDSFHLTREPTTLKSDLLLNNWSFKLTDPLFFPSILCMSICIYLFFLLNFFFWFYWCGFDFFDAIFFNWVLNN